MALKKRYDYRDYTWIVFVLVAFLGSVNDIFAAEQKQGSELSRYRVYAPKNINAEQAKEYLNQLKLGTVSQVAGSNTILITGTPDELSKASEILGIVDTEEKYQIRPILGASENGGLPPFSKIAAGVGGNISIGTFAEPPLSTAQIKVLLDTYNGEVYLIAPIVEIERIANVIEKLKQGQAGSRGAKDSNAVNVTVAKETPDKNEIINDNKTVTSKANEGESDLFNELLEPLDEAEKISEQERSEKIEPNIIKTKPVTVTKTHKAEEQKKAKKETAEQYESVTVPLPELPESSVAEEANKITKKTYEADVNLPEGEQELELNLPDKLEISDLLTLVGQYLHLKYLYNPEKVKGAVTLKVDQKVKVKELYPLIEQVLKFQGFVMTRRDNLVTIVPAEEATTIDPALAQDAEGKIRVGDVIVTRVYKLTYADTATAKTLLDNWKLGLSIQTIPETKTLIVIEYTSRIPRIEKLLAIIDTPGEPRQYRYRQLKYTSAKTLAPQIKALADQLGTITVTIAKTAETTEAGRQPGQRRAPVPPQQPGQPVQPGQPGQPQKTEQTSVQPGIFLDADERTNRIMMIGSAEDLDIVDELINSLDVEKQDLRSLRVYEMQHVGADEIMEKLVDLGIISTGPRTREGTTGTRGRTDNRQQQQQQQNMPQTQRPEGTMQAGSETKEPLTEEPQIVILEATNSLLVNATTEQHAQIAMIIGYVDSEQRRGAINYIVYPLENQDPNKLASILNKLITETVTEQGQEGQQQQRDSKIVRTQNTTTKKKTEEDITIVPDPKTYSLIVYASKKNQVWISALIKQLDEYRPQVLLDVTLVEITENDAFRYEIDLLSQVPAFVTGGAVLKADLLNPAGRFLPSTFPAQATTDAGSISGWGTAFYADNHIQTLIQAMEHKGYGRVLARPKLLANDNEKGVIKTEQVTNIPQQTAIVQAGSGVGTSSTTSSTTFLPYKAGIELDIQPHISKGNQLRLQVTLKRTDFQDNKLGTKLQDGNSTIAIPPDTLSTDVNTVATVPDGFTIILGGLEQLNQKKDHSKVPIIGDIPLIGGLFRQANNSGTMSRLYVFVKAHILRPGEKLIGSDIEKVSLENRAAFEEYEQKFQQLQDWPGINPKVQDPNQVLKEREEVPTHDTNSVE
jgi:general secretion pathway protein D